MENHFVTTLKVRTYECDLYGHVNNAVFLNYFEMARVEFLYYLGFSLQSLKKEGFLLPIVKIEIEYKKPVFPGEELELALDWTRKGKTSATFRQVAKRNGETVAAADVTWVVTDLQGKPIDFPETLLRAFNEKVRANKTS